MRVWIAAAAALAFAASTAASGGPRRDRGLIVYWTHSPYPSIWAIRPDGGGRRRILRSRQNAKRPRLSHDRGWVAFDGAPPGKLPLSDFDIQIVRLDGAGRRTLTSTDDWDVDAQWSPDDTRLSFTRMPSGGNSDDTTVWTVRRDGTNLVSLGAGSVARWSPDGTRLVISAPTGRSAGDLFVIDLVRSTRRLLLASLQLDQPTDWSRNGRKILFTRSFSDHTSAVFVMNADGTSVRRLAAGSDARWSPDGSHVLYTRDAELRTMRPDGSGQRLVTRWPAWEPDWR
jgi:Tol biopolymer transport system component